VSNFLLGRYDLAYRDFREALHHLRDNQTMCVCAIFLGKYSSFVHSDYEQIGLNFKLFPAEVLFNQGLCLIRLEQMDKGLADLKAARELKATKDHDIVDDAIRRRGHGYTVFSIVRFPLLLPWLSTLTRHIAPRDMLPSF
jgi:tetratricopeptide (TPR) repeat protein